ncbi:MAG: hypothetical protein QGH47_01660 [Candidatus Woesearchaeota archaeon]|nr:hypothetical protein [Candidatus Woesearchaeota archaeon]
MVNPLESILNAASELEGKTGDLINKGIRACLNGLSRVPIVGSGLLALMIGLPNYAYLQHKLPFTDNPDSAPAQITLRTMAGVAFLSYFWLRAHQNANSLDLNLDKPSVRYEPIYPKNILGTGAQLWDAVLQRRLLTPLALTTYRHVQNLTERIQNPDFLEINEQMNITLEQSLNTHFVDQSCWLAIGLPWYMIVSTIAHSQNIRKYLTTFVTTISDALGTKEFSLKILESLPDHLKKTFSHSFGKHYLRKGYPLMAIQAMRKRFSGGHFDTNYFAMQWVRDLTLVLDIERDGKAYQKDQTPFNKAQWGILLGIYGNQKLAEEIIQSIETDEEKEISYAALRAEALDTMGSKSLAADIRRAFAKKIIRNPDINRRKVYFGSHQVSRIGMGDVIGTWFVTKESDNREELDLESLDLETHRELNQTHDYSTVQPWFVVENHRGGYELLLSFADGETLYTALKNKKREPLLKKAGYYAGREVAVMPCPNIEESEELLLQQMQQRLEHSDKAHLTEDIMEVLPALFARRSLYPEVYGLDITTDNIMVDIFDHLTRLDLERRVARPFDDAAKLSLRGNHFEVDYRGNKKRDMWITRYFMEGFNENRQREENESPLVPGVFHWDVYVAGFYRALSLYLTSQERPREKGLALEWVKNNVATMSHALEKYANYAGDDSPAALQKCVAIARSFPTKT